MLAWLAGLAGKSVISVQHLQGQSADLTTVNRVHDASGKWVAGLGGDYFDDSGEDANIDYATQNQGLIAWWNAGGVVTMCEGTPNPSGGGQSNTSVDIQSVLTAGTAANTAWIGIMNEIGQGLLQLQSAGVVVLWRPLHEMNGDWNWWGTGISPSQFVQLWRMWHDYNTMTLGLNNLIYVYASNGGDLSRYPGDDYVDIVGYDDYTSNPASDGTASYNAFLTPNAAMGYGATKPIAYCEFGAGGPAVGDTSFDETNLISTLQQNMPKSIYWEQWWDRWGMDQVQNISAALNSPYVLTRDNLHRPPM